MVGNEGGGEFDSTSCTGKELSETLPREGPSETLPMDEGWNLVGVEVGEVSKTKAGGDGVEGVGDGG